MTQDSRRCRPFNLGDGLIVVAATALGLSWLRFHSNSLANVYANAREFASSAPVFLSAWTLGFLGCRLRKPRPNRRRLMRQPGLIACASIVLFSASIMVLVAIDVVMESVGNPAIKQSMFSELYRRTLEALLIPEPVMLLFSGLTVVVAWALFAIAGQLRREAGWIDGVGITLGFGWIALMLLCLYNDL